MLVKKIFLGSFLHASFSKTDREEQNLFLEGTGSLVIDWQKNVAFVCLSQRSSLRVAEDFVDKFAAASGVRLKLVTFEGRALATLIDITLVCEK